MDERTYELALLRTLGFKTNQLITLLSSQTLLFAIPASILGLVVMFLIFSAIRIAIYQVMRVPMSSDATWDPKIIAMTLAVGVALPLISNMGPIRKAVGTSLRDALDVSRKKKVDYFTVKLTQLNQLGISPVQMILGLFFTVSGFCMYYFVPLSMMYRMPTLFFFIFMSILFTMLVGLLLMATLALPTFESILLHALTLPFPGDRTLRPIIRANLRSHRERNHKTALMLMIAVCFVVFAGSAFSQFEYIAIALTRSIVNGDVSLFIANVYEGSSPISI